MSKVRSSQTTVRVKKWAQGGNKQGQKPIKLVVTHQRDRRYYAIKYENSNLLLSADELKAVLDDDNSLRGKARLRSIRDEITTTKAKALAAIDAATANDTPFTFKRFEDEFLLKESKSGFLTVFQKHLDTLLAEKRIGTYRAYSNAKSAFSAFLKGEDIAPIDITPTLLKDFETFMMGEKRGASRNTVSMYARALRVMYNICCEANPDLKKFYPFAITKGDRLRYRIRTAKAKGGEPFTVEQMQAFIDTDPDKDSPEYEAKQLFLFSFYANGMNMKDICHLKYQDIVGQTIVYLRAKTALTEAEETPVEIPLTEPLRKIIKSIGNPDKRPTSYVFNILQRGLTPLQQDSRHRDKIKKVNQALKSLCESTGLPVAKTGTAKDSYATMLRDSGQSVETIKELLGHSDVSVTEAYLAKFDIKRKRHINEGLASLFKQKSA